MTITRVATQPARGQEDETRVPVGVRMSSIDKERGKYWADKEGYPSFNEYIVEAVAEKNARAAGDFDVPDLLTARINQLIDENKAMSTNLANLERVMTTGLDSLLQLTRGDSSYLSDSEDGEL